MRNVRLIKWPLMPIFLKGLRFLYLRSAKPQCLCAVVHADDRIVESYICNSCAAGVAEILSSLRQAMPERLIISINE